VKCHKVGSDGKEWWGEIKKKKEEECLDRLVNGWAGEEIEKSGDEKGR
jgi:hypothetical protein